MNCDEAEELLGAYALDALPEGEMAAVRAHLASCREHAAKASELRSVAASLNATVEPVAPPDALRRRVVAGVAATAAAPTRLDRRREPSATARPAARIRWRPAYAFGAIAAVLVMAVAGLAAWNVSLRSELDDRVSPESVIVWPLQDASDPAASSGYVVYYSEDDRVTVVGEGLPQPESGKTYQLWAVSDVGRPTSIGLMDVDVRGRAIATAPFRVDGALNLAITIEPAGGSPQPTSDPIFVAQVKL
jgi:anti-sigma-K factor RskA